MRVDPNIYLSDNFLTVDFETFHGGASDVTAVNPDCHVLLAVWEFHGKIKYQWGTELELQALYTDMAQADYIVAHNAKFELGYMQRAGVNTHKVIVADTKLAEYTLLGNLQQPTHLEDSCQRNGLPPRQTKYVSRLIRRSICPSTIPRSLLLEYCIEDVTRERDLWKLQREALHAAGMLPVFTTSCFVTPALAAIEFEGMHVSQLSVEKEYVKQTATLQKLEAELSEMAGGINFRSGPQVAEYVYNTLGFAQLRNKRGDIRLTPTGRPLTDTDTLLSLKATNKKQKKFISTLAAVRAAGTRLSKILNPLHNLVTDHEDNAHILYANFNQAITKTHRLSSTGKAPYNLQFQNFPRSYKHFFDSRRPGWKLVVADYCVEPSTLILTEDLIWKEAGSLTTDDVLIGFTEQDLSRRGCKYEQGTIEKVKRLRKPCVRITTQYGTTVCSIDHQWVGSKGQSSGGLQPYQWLRTDQLRAGDAIAFFDKPWTQDTSWEGAWLAGLVGSLSLIGKYQSILRRRKAVARLCLYNRPVQVSYRAPARIISIEDVGEQEVVAIQTSTRTFIANGMLSHNCQLEFNVAAFLAQCPVAMADVKEALDVHRQSATIMAMATGKGKQVLQAVDNMSREEWKEKILEMSKDDPRRQAAKPDTFGPLYGKMSGTPAQVAYFDWFRSHYHGMESTMKGWIAEALETKQTVQPTGLVAHWPYCKVMADGYITNSTNIRNYPIQYFASAEITLPALRMLWDALHEQGCKARIVSTVHDSIVLEVPDNEVSKVGDMLHNHMVDGVYEYLQKMYGIEYNLPLRIDVSVGQHWGA